MKREERLKLQRENLEREAEERGKLPLQISIMDAAALGVERLRQSNWADPMDHIKIDIIEGKPGPWIKLYCPFNLRCNGRDPVPTLINMYKTWTRGFEVYRGPLPDSDEYKAAVAAFGEGPI